MFLCSSGFCGKTFPLTKKCPYMWDLEEKQPKAILERRMVKRKNRTVSQVLIKWKGMDFSEATWEDYAVVAGKLPSTNFAAKLNFKGKALSQA